VGSADLTTVLSDLEPLLKDLDKALDPDSALIENRSVASHWFLAIVYARLFIFHAFLERVSGLPGGIAADEYKKIWLLIQIAPKSLTGEDLFSDLTRLVGGSLSTENLKTSTTSKRSQIRTMLPAHAITIHHVLDEAQELTEKFSNCFRGGKNSDAPRPILRVVFQTWSPMAQHLIVSGTGLSMKQVTEVWNSFVAKEETKIEETQTDLGAFEEPEKQLQYLERYLPSSILNSAPGIALVRRVAHWLYGRYVNALSYSCSEPMVIIDIVSLRPTSPTLSRMVLSRPIEC
jgi:hypothetical protein